MVEKTFNRFSLYVNFISDVAFYDGMYKILHRVFLEVYVRKFRYFGATVKEIMRKIKVKGMEKF